MRGVIASISGQCYTTRRHEKTEGSCSRPGQRHAGLRLLTKAFTETYHWVCAAAGLCGRDAGKTLFFSWGQMIEVVCGSLGTTSGVLAGSALLRRASGKGSVSQIQLTGWRPEGHEARVGRGERAVCGNAKPRHLCRLLHMYARHGQYPPLLHTAGRVEAHEGTGADLCPMGDQPSTSATSRFVVIQHSGARRSGRASAPDLCSRTAATDDAETTQAAAGQAGANRLRGQDRTRQRPHEA